MGPKLIRCKRSVKVEMFSQNIYSRRGKKVQIPVNKFVGVADNYISETNILGETDVIGSSGAGVESQAFDENVDNALFKSRYEQSKQLEAEQWAEVRESLLSAKFFMELPSSCYCSICHQDVTTDALIRCRDCGPYILLCQKCEEDQHLYKLHRPEVWWNVRLF